MVKELLSRRKAQESLLEFTNQTFLNFQAGRHHQIIAEALEDVELGRCKRLMIFAPPRHTKSELASRRFPAWYIGKNPDKQIICATYGQEFADDFGHDVRQIVRGERYKLIFPGCELSEDSQAKNKWRTKQGGIYISVGVDGPLTGRGANIALIDDPIKSKKEADSETYRNNVWNWYTSVFRTRLMPDGAVVLVMTRWHEDDLAGRLLEQSKNGGEQWRVVSLPAMCEGEALWPEWYDVKALEAIKSVLVPRDWQSLYQQDPTPDDGEYFKREWFRRYTDLPKSLNIYMSGDFAVTEDDGDYTSIMVWGVDHVGQIFALDRWYKQSESEGMIWQLIHMIIRWKPWAFIGEGGPIRRAIEPFLMRLMAEKKVSCVIEWLTGGGDKPANCRSFQAMLSCGRIYFPYTDWAEEVIANLLKFPGGKHDDDVDACGLFGRHIATVWDANRPPEPKQLSWYEPIYMKDLMVRKRA